MNGHRRHHRFGRLATPLALDGIEVIGIDIARDVATIETGGIENRQVVAQVVIDCLRASISW
jgi:2-polyprenyl-3-methyl-5-hydroxy-6-metoxy-1,4-benzoquinol methylase